ncbi:MAG: uracil-DNA glycosylase [Candidatus Neomarinimicrobiota bacterium]
MDKVADENLIRYLAQSRQLYGDELYRQRVPGVAEPPAPMTVKNVATLDAYQAAISDCQACVLGAKRTNFVFGVGDPEADLVCVGEAPGADEDAQGLPFVGRAGKLLDKILAAIQLSREKNVYICNVLKCRPPNNRDPLESEVDLCEPYLIRQLELIRPRLIVALGRVAAKTLLKLDASVALKDLRNKLHDYHGTPLVVTYHPAALLRSEKFKRPTWEDFKWIRQILEAED